MNRQGCLILSIGGQHQRGRDSKYLCGVLRQHCAQCRIQCKEMQLQRVANHKDADNKHKEQPTMKSKKKDNTRLGRERYKPRYLTYGSKQLKEGVITEQQIERFTKPLKHAKPTSAKGILSKEVALLQCWECNLDRYVEAEGGIVSTVCPCGGQCEVLVVDGVVKP